MVAGGDGSQGPGARSSGAPKEHDVLSARPSPSEPGLASESAGRSEQSDEEVPPRNGGGIKRFSRRKLGREARERAAVAPNHLPVCSAGREVAPSGCALRGGLGSCQK